MSAFEEAGDAAVGEDAQTGVGGRAGPEEALDGPGAAFVVAELHGDVLPPAAGAGESATYRLRDDVEPAGAGKLYPAGEIDQGTGRFAAHAGVANVTTGLNAGDILRRHVLLSRDAVASARERWGSPPDLVILDVMMPGRSGWELLEELRDGGDETAVIFLTARQEVDDLLAGLRGLGCELEPIHCGDRFRSVPPHERAVRMGISRGA